VKTAGLLALGASGLAVLAQALSCNPGDPQTGSQTNWLRTCEVSAECGAQSCICGTCTRPCDDDDGCSNLEDATCVPASEEGAIAVCSGSQYPGAGLCLPRCDDEPCPEGSACVAGVCSPIPEASTEVTVDLSTRHQTLVGFGASLAYVEDEIVARTDKLELYDLMFEDSGVDAVRMRNRFEADNEGDLGATSEILSEASQRLGRAPLTLITSGSPPSWLKASGSKVCAGNPDTCTLVQASAGGFDYAGFADYWRLSLEAHAAAGIALDYLSIQNNPNWVPPESDPADACRFLPVEGTATVVVGGVETEVSYPGFVEALSAVRAAIVDLPNPPLISAPDASGAGALLDYTAVLDPAQIDALSYHLYDLDPAAVDDALLEEIDAEAEQLGRPVFQTEMRAGGLETAVLIQAALVSSGASTYLQNDFVASASQAGGDDHALISLTADGFEAEDCFHALRHFARFTDPGWVRIDTSASAVDLLASAWLSPDEDALTVVLVNRAVAAQSVSLDLGGEEFDASEVTRTTFDGLERSALLGALSSESVVTLPARSIVTVALTR